MAHYANLVEAIIDLHSRGYLVDFTVIGKELVCTQNKIILAKGDFEIVEMHVIDLSGNGEKSIVYAVEAVDYGLKGIILEKVPKPAWICFPSFFAKV